MYFFLQLFKVIWNWNDFAIFTKKNIFLFLILTAKCQTIKNIYAMKFNCYRKKITKTNYALYFRSPQWHAKNAQKRKSIEIYLLNILNIFISFHVPSLKLKRLCDFYWKNIFSFSDIELNTTVHFDDARKTKAGDTNIDDISLTKVSMTKFGCWRWICAKVT